jgi:hypothetical protein
MGGQGTASAWRELEQGGNQGEGLACFAARQGTSRQGDKVVSLSGDRIREKTDFSTPIF